MGGAPGDAREASRAPVTDLLGAGREHELRARVLEVVDEGYFVVDRDFRILTANRAFAEQSGSTPREVQGRRCHCVSHHLEAPCFLNGEDCAVRHVFEGEGSHSSLHRHIGKKGGVRFIETKAYPLKDEAGAVVAAIEITKDVTERRRLEDDLHQSQKLEAIGLLAGGVAHDFNNILMAIMGYCHLVEDGLPEHSPVQGYLQQIMASAERAAGLTTALLAFSRRQRVDPRPMNLDETVDEAWPVLTRLVARGVDLHRESGGGGLVVVADAGQVHQVLVNLVSNARNALSEGGRIVVSTAEQQMDAAFVTSAGFGRPGRYAVLSVRDDGQGMDDTTIARVFDPFFTTREPGRGAGLGLSVVHGIVSRSNGFIRCSSSPGKGSTFTVYLPLDDSKSVQAPQPELVVPAGGDETVLVAEDDEATRELVRLVLTEHGYRVIEAADGAEAVRIYLEHSAPIDLVLLDMVMPRMGGPAALRAIRQRHPDVRALFMTGLPPEGAPLDDVLVLGKPIAPIRLLARVRASLD